MSDMTKGEMMIWAAVFANSWQRHCDTVREYKLNNFDYGINIEACCEEASGAVDCLRDAMERHKEEGFGDSEDHRWTRQMLQKGSNE